MTDSRTETVSASARRSSYETRRRSGPTTRLKSWLRSPKVFAKRVRHLSDRRRQARSSIRCCSGKYNVSRDSAKEHVPQGSHIASIPIDSRKDITWFTCGGQDDMGKSMIVEAPFVRKVTSSGVKKDQKLGELGEGKLMQFIDPKGGLSGCVMEPLAKIGST